VCSSDLSLNSGKFQEFQDLLKTYPEIELVTAEGKVRNAEKLAFAEKYSTYLENAVAKGRLCNHGSHYPSLADDSGIEASALEGKPGVFSHRYAKLPPGTFASRVNQDKANIDLLLKEMKGESDRSARFVSTLAIVMEGILIHATAKLEGTLTEEPRGTHGFGYDPIFIPQGSTKTLAEMSISEKNALSHRKKALDMLMLEVKARGIVFVKP
jgi:XTP/dITP diphosphohydrolase